jgi:hypothetical protein
MAKIDSTPQAATPQAKYKVKNWSEYNAGLKKRGSLTLWVDDEVIRSWKYQGEAKRGGQFEYSDNCIRTLLMLKVAFKLAFRQLEGFAGSVLKLMGVDLKVPSYTQICRRQKGLKIDLGISDRLKKGENIHMVIDSSGLKIYGEGEWKVRKFGYSKRRTWRKIHLGVDEKSGEIVSQVLTVNDVDDASMLAPLLVDALDEGVMIDKIGTDGAYDTYEIWDMLQGLGIGAIIPPRENAVYQLGPKKKVTDHPRNKVLERIDDGGLEANRKGWKQESGYHRRSISENVFYRWKTIHGDKMYARKFENQETEAAVKSAVLNRFIQIAKPVSAKAA